VHNDAYDVMVSLESGRREKRMGRWVICVVATVHVAGIGIQRQTQTGGFLGGMQTKLLKPRRTCREVRRSLWIFGDWRFVFIVNHRMEMSFGGRSERAVLVLAGFPG
jgi:hypothetical protein